MKLFRAIKSVVQSIARKRQSRRDRIKATSRNVQYGRNWQTDAQGLIESYYGPRFRTAPVETGAGVERARKRLAEHRKKFAHIPKQVGKSRQVLRWEARKARAGEALSASTRYFGRAA
jgi:hypothetical protein